MRFPTPVMTAGLILAFGALNVDAWFQFLVLAARVIAISIRAARVVIAAAQSAKAIATVLTLTDLTLNIANVVSGGCMYEKEICDLKPEIEQLERDMVPLYNELGTLDKDNNQMYGYLTTIMEKRNELAQLSNKVQYLTVSIIQKIGEPSKLDNLAREFESKTNNLMRTFDSELRQYRQSMAAKAVQQGVSDASLLLYFGAKSAYINAKAAGKMPSPAVFKSIKFPSAGFIKVGTPKIVTKISTTLTAARVFATKPSVVKFASWATKGGAVLGSLAGLGLTLAIDIPQARKMRDSLRNTRDEMKRSMAEINQELVRERQNKQDMNLLFNQLKGEYRQLVEVVNPSLKNRITVNMAATPSQFIADQTRAIASFKQVVADLEKMNQNLDVINEVKLGVSFNDDVSRIIYAVRVKGLGTVSQNEILTIIAQQFPSMSSYKGHNLTRFRSA